ncbi:hypothetical protein A2690_01175 [Candidatus Roizmanbacteria bacterium RIFCSPHIGHO2_01_FULL_39_12b]|uniref:Glycosyl transferase family 1 domain-containing protein n=1 Tax=Candidatus Roizmanbacteria bacterium RIFCSPHIGHO2_01_FULL_39_12b TaxID=1802030 RepID=A0A1F7GBT2_9BACT|nr:MAG: hypothetical protein A2690_01175 [Candidatus Roizmanbacteria bacterium RIFCSPHIGHO2_01_FULL_39_12b]
MKILFARGAFLNPFECQNYKSIADENDFVAVSSLSPLSENLPFTYKKFASPYDLVMALSKINPLLGKGANFVENRLLGDGQFLIGLEKYVAENGPFDIGWGAETYFGYTLQLARLKERGIIKKLVTTCWEIIPYNNETVLKKKRIKEFVKSNVDLFICPTDLAKKALVEEGVDSHKIEVIRMGVDLKKFHPADKKPEVKTVLFVGRFDEQKGTKDLPKIFEEIYKTNKDLIFKVVGDGFLRNWLERKTKNLPVEIGPVPYDRMPSVYQESSVLIVPSRSTPTLKEQYGMVIVEAISCGVPVVAYNSGAISEVVGDFGVIIKEGDTQGMGMAVVEIITNTTKYNKISQNGSKRARPYFNSGNISPIVENLLRGLIRS